MFAAFVDFHHGIGCQFQAGEPKTTYEETYQRILTSKGKNLSEGASDQEVEKRLFTILKLILLLCLFYNRQEVNPRQVVTSSRMSHYKRIDLGKVNYS